MNKPMHHFSDLFAQLGLPNDDDAIQSFIASHFPLSSDYRLPDAPFWSPTQAAFLREAILQDSDWVVMIDQLSVSLREV